MNMWGSSEAKQKIWTNQGKFDYKMISLNTEQLYIFSFFRPM